MMRLMGDIVLLCGGIVGAILGLSLLLAYTIGPATCSAQTAGMKLQHQWSFWGDCRVLTEKDGWIPLENYRSFK